MVIREPYAQVMQQLHTFKEVTGPLKQKNYSLVKGNRTIASAVVRRTTALRTAV